MIHFLPESDPMPVNAPADVLARVAGLDHALATTQSLGGHVPTPTRHDIADVWPTATDAQHALFDAMSAHAVAGSVAGLEALATLRGAGLEANRAAIDTLTRSIRDELDRLGTLLTL